LKVSLPIPIVDIFAGPGGLGEGFSSLGRENDNPIFETAIAAEMDKHAHRTLTLRSFFRQFPQHKAPKSYYEYIAGNREIPYSDKTINEWNIASKKVLHVELGKAEDDILLDKKLEDALKGRGDWVLLGGPPCQAYSTIGRWKYKTAEGHDIGRDSRAHLYKQYLRIIHKHCPTVFVMENVRGLLSSKYFDLIMEDLKKPNSKGQRYTLHSVCQPLDKSSSPQLEPTDFLIRAEEYGIPQRRHRVIIMGVLETCDIAPGVLTKSNRAVSVNNAIGDLPALRSGLSKLENTDANWRTVVARIIAHEHEATDCKMTKQLGKLTQTSKEKPKLRNQANQEFFRWVHDKNLPSVLNHETRGHIEEDLARYYFASNFALRMGVSPKDLEFPERLDPNHKSWKKNKFNDRFRVQVSDQPSTTVVSHISKDGHSFIHPDPMQCRSLTVREAARLQTFPDNYFFEGPRTEQYKQVGNAVPPLLAYKIAQIVANVLEQNGLPLD
jgi:DNA (cytosine-5)-methyltransferase 1